MARTAEKYVVRLKPLHDASGLSRYRVSKETGISENTLKKYLDPNVVEFTRQLPIQVIQLAEFYGADWREVVEVVFEEVPEEEETKTPLAVPA